MGAIKHLSLFQTAPQKTTRKQEGGGIVEGLILCMLGWASDGVREIMAVLWGSSVKRLSVGSGLASPRLCVCWQSAEPKWICLAETKSPCVRQADKAADAAASVPAWQRALPRRRAAPVGTVVPWALPLFWTALGNRQFSCYKRVAAKLPFSHLVPV